MTAFQVDDEMFGIDWDGPLPDITCDSHVEVPLVESPLTDSEYTELCEQINPIADSEEHGMDIYINCLEFIRSKLNSHTM